MGDWMIQFLTFVGLITSFVAVAGVFIIAFKIFWGNSGVWFRLGLGLLDRKIAIFADTEYQELKEMLINSGLIREKNLIPIGKKSIDKAREASVFLVHYKAFADEMEEILRLKEDRDALIVYCAPEDGWLPEDVKIQIEKKRNTFLVNFRGRLLGDLFSAMITTGHAKNGHR